MLKGKGRGLQMGENSDQAFLLRQAVFDNLIANEKRLHGRLWDVGHGSILRGTNGNGHRDLRGTHALS